VFKIYVKSICSTESKVCFVHTHIKYPALSLSHYISIALPKSYQDTHKKPTALFAHHCGGRRWRGRLNTASFALYLPHLRWQPGCHTDQWTPERTGRHL